LTHAQREQKSFPLIESIEKVSLRPNLRFIPRNGASLEEITVKISHQSAERSRASGLRGANKSGAGSF
jgi:hypothetical protein